MTAVLLALTFALLVFSWVNLWRVHKRIHKTEEILGQTRDQVQAEIAVTQREIDIAQRDIDLFESLNKSGEVCVTFDEKNHIRQHWMPVPRMILGRMIVDDCVASAPSGTAESEIGDIRTSLPK